MVQIKNTDFHKMLTDGWELFLTFEMFLSAVWMLIVMAPIHSRWSISEQVT